MQAARTELCSVRDLIRWAASRFGEAELCYGHGTDNAVDEAAALVLGALHLPPDAGAELLQAALTSAEKAQVVALVARRIRERVPVAYLTGEAWFAGLAFRVDQRVLVPRSPLAEWIERGFAPWLDADGARRVLDVGTGSGCLAVACAFAFPGARVDAVDVSDGALEVARGNVERHGLGGRVHVLRSDLFSDVRGTYDLILSNPPYVDARTLAALPPEYRHEPETGLDGGEDGLAKLHGILARAGAFLSAAGVLVVEVGDSRAALERAYPELPFTWLDFERGGENVFLLTAQDLRP